jgi:hypothetical protein
MAGLRVISGSLTPQTSLAEGLTLLVDHVDFPQARKLDIKYVGNSLVQGKDVSGDPWGIVKSTTTLLRLSTDGGTNWSSNFTIPTGVGVVALLSALTGDDRLHIDAIRGTETLINPTEYESIQFDTIPTITGHSAGRLYWDETCKTLAMDTDVTGVTLQLGQEQYVRVRNVTGATITNGSVVYINNSVGQTPTVALANAGAASTSKLLGVATESIAHNAYGYITTFGIVRDINTNGLAEGDVIYLSTTNGLFTTTAPAKPNYVVKIGIVLNGHITQGKILVNVGLDWSNKASVKDLVVNGQLDTNDIITTNNKYHYWGETTADGSWRMGLSGDNFIIERREGGSWVTKSTIQA